MKSILTTTLILISLSIFGQNELILNDKVKSIHELFPKNWRILDSITGDLNSDGVLDFIFAIQNTNKDSLKLNDSFGIDTINLNTRVLGIYFGSKDGGFIQKFVSNSFIILREPRMDEPFEGFLISKKGILSINFRLWYNAGSWYSSIHTYQFRYQNEEFVLIGYDSNVSNRATGETTENSINFLTKKMKITKGDYSNDKPTKILWKKIKLDNQITLNSIIEPFNSSIEGVTY